MIPFVPILAVAAAEPAAMPEEDIVVLGQRMRRFRFAIEQDKKSGVLSCEVRRKSGDAALDVMLCQGAQDCVAENPGHAKGTRPDLPAFQTCLEARFETIRAIRSGAAGQGAR